MIFLSPLQLILNGSNMLTFTHVIANEVKQSNEIATSLTLLAMTTYF